MTDDSEHAPLDPGGGPSPHWQPNCTDASCSTLRAVAAAEPVSPGPPSHGEANLDGPEDLEEVDFSGLVEKPEEEPEPEEETPPGPSVGLGACHGTCAASGAGAGAWAGAGTDAGAGDDPSPGIRARDA
jgi:hypothetical protein